LKCKSAKQECMEADYEVQMYRTWLAYTGTELDANTNKQK
jgi:hypothetical protein